MKLESVSAFLAMGGYAGYVWGSFAAAVVILALEVAVLVGRHRKLQRPRRG